jgi:hypothetical protein
MFLVAFGAAACAACGPGPASTRPGAGTGAGGDGDPGPTPSSNPSNDPPHGADGGLIVVTGDPGADAASTVRACPPPPRPAGANAVLAPEYAAAYSAYELGEVPGVPFHLGGCVIAHDDPNTLYFAGTSEAQDGGLYAVKVARDACQHIVGFVGEAKKVASTPYIDANLLYTASNVLFYSGWPVYELSQLLPGAASPARTVDLMPLGMNDSAGGIGFVPANLPGAGGLRAVGWPAGEWYHIDYTADGDLFRIGQVRRTNSLPNGAGGFAYVPAGSPLFPKQSILEAEWDHDHVATYEVDDQGDPLPESRKDFFTTFPKPWGAYFEPLTGDYVFLTWQFSPPDIVFVVQGFEKPLPPAPIPR